MIKKIAPVTVEVPPAQLVKCKPPDQRKTRFDDPYLRFIQSFENEIRPYMVGSLRYLLINAYRLEDDDPEMAEQIRGFVDYATEFLSQFAEISEREQWIDRTNLYQKEKAKGRPKLASDEEDDDA